MVGTRQPRKHAVQDTACSSECMATSLFEAVNERDVRVVETRENLRFSLEPGEAIRIRGKCLGQDLQCHLATQLGIGP